jgi:hypothetical protein
MKRAVSITVIQRIKIIGEFHVTAENKITKA